MVSREIFTWPIGYQSDSIPTAFVTKFETEIKAWALSPFNPSKETINLGGVDLIRRDWGGVTHIAPMRPIDYWALVEWTDEPIVNLLPANPPPDAQPKG